MTAAHEPQYLGEPVRITAPNGRSIVRRPQPTATAADGTPIYVLPPQGHAHATPQARRARKRAFKGLTGPRQRKVA